MCRCVIGQHEKRAHLLTFLDVELHRVFGRPHAARHGDCLYLVDRQANFLQLLEYIARVHRREWRKCRCALSRLSDCDRTCAQHDQADQQSRTCDNRPLLTRPPDSLRNALDGLCSTLAERAYLWLGRTLRRWHEFDYRRRIDGHTLVRAIALFFNALDLRRLVFLDRFLQRRRRFARFGRRGHLLTHFDQRRYRNRAILRLNDH